MIRIQQLDLAFFGHFTNKRFDFGKRDPDVPDFHIVYGVNEAGKTTFMEAYLRLLYGFLPRNEPYAFRHGRASLSIGALLELDGQTRTFQRKSAARNSLVDAQGNVLPEASLQAHLGGLTMDDYRKLLCIDDESIDKGGEEIVNSRGDIGTLLFSAAAGISDLWQVLESVRTDAETLHKSRASKSRLATLKKEYTDVVKQIKVLDIPASKLGQLTKALQKAEAAEVKALGEQRLLMGDVRQLESLANALPILQRLDIKAQEVAKLARYPQHLDITSKQIIELQTEQIQAQAEQKRLQKWQAELADKLKQLPPEPAYGGLETVIEGLSELHSRYRHAELELDKQLEALSSVNSRMSTLVRDRLHLELDAGDLVVEASVIKSLTRALAQRTEAARLVEEEQQRIRQLDSRIQAQETLLLDLEKVTPEGAGLGDLLEQYNAHTLSGEYKAATRALQDAQQVVEDSLDGLSIKGRRFSKLPPCPVMVEEVEELVERTQRLTTLLASERAREQTDQQKLKAFMLERSQLESVAGLVSDQDTQNLKQLREQAWTRHKQSLTLETAEAFEPTLRDVDLAMEGRLAHASDVARLRDIHRQIPDIQGQLDSLAQTIRTAEHDLQSTVDDLAKVMQHAGIDEVLPPRVILNWVRSYHDAQSRVRGLERLRNQHAPVLDKAQRLHDALMNYIKREQATLDELIQAASTMLELFRQHDDSRRKSKQALEELQAKRASAVTQLELVQEKYRNTCTVWETLVTASFPVKLDAQALAPSVDVLSELRECHVEREALQTQCRQMQRDKTLFTEKIEQIIHDNGLEQGSTPDSSLHLLKELSAQARRQVDERNLLEKNLEKASVESAAAEKRLDAVKAQCQVLSAMFHDSIPTDDLAELFEAVQKAQEARMRRKECEEVLNSLRQTLGVSTEEQARAMLAELDSQTVQAERVKKESELALVNERSKEATEKRTRCEEQLSALTGDGEVAHLVELRTTLELQMSEVALEYLRLSLGHRLAEQAINRYRDKHRSGMMEATERAFAQLTDGKYSTLQTQSNGKEETLLAIDSDGTAKRADAMSKGTRFQLYLALRAAAYDQLAEQGTCLPFICDDIFETFDENRTRAACRVMERIGQRGQAIYLTHHQHVVDLAREVCADRVRVHEL